MGVPLSKDSFNDTHELFTKTLSTVAVKAPVAPQQLGCPFSLLTKSLFERQVGKEYPQGEKTIDGFFAEMSKERKFKLTDLYTCALLHSGMPSRSHSSPSWANIFDYEFSEVRLPPGRNELSSQHLPIAHKYRMHK